MSDNGFDTVAMATVPVPEESRADAEKWQAEIRAWEQRSERWYSRADQIIRRFRDERNQAMVQRRRMSTLWSNVQTLAPALFSRTPVPIVERRYLDRDPVGRVASQILERNLRYAMEDIAFSTEVRLAVQDRLLPGLGQVWVRYSPEWEEPVQLGSEAVADAGPVVPDGSDAEQEAEDQHEQEEAELTQMPRERVCLDYVYWKDFGFTEARVWEEVSAVWRRVYLTRAELVERFGEEVGKNVPLDARPTDLDRSIDNGRQRARRDYTPTKAEVYEIWCRASRSVYWVSLHYPGVLDERPDPLRLDSFWPCPRPLLSTTTSETLVPIPDYVFYQDQAQEIDDLTQRIAALTKALKVAGVYDSSVQELSRLLTEGTENKLIPVKDWAALSQKGGIPGAVSFIPLKEIAETLLGLYEARERVKADMYEITGMSDIVRGQAQGGSATATEQRIKGQFASLRLQDRQTEVAEFCRDVLRIIGELIAEHYTPETLVKVSGIEFVDNLAGMPPPPAPPAPTQGPQQGPLDAASPAGAPGAPAGLAADPQAAYQAALQQWEATAQARREDILTQAIELLRDEKLRGFRIEIETDSTLQSDPQMDKEARVQFLQAASGFIQQAVSATAQVPEIAPLMGRMLLFGVRGFRVGRDLESSFEDFIEIAEENVQQAKSQPAPPSPEQVKAQMEAQKGQLELQKMQMQGQLEGQRMQAQTAKDQQDAALAAQNAQVEAQLAAVEAQLKQQELLIKQEELRIKQEELEIKRQEMQMRAAEAAQKHQIAMTEMAARAAASTQEETKDVA